MPQRGSADYQVQLSDSAGDAQWGQVHPGICCACAHGLQRESDRLRAPGIWERAEHRAA